MAPAGTGKSKIRGNAVDFPVAVAGWVGAGGAVHLVRRLGGGIALAFGAARRGFGQRALGGCRERTPLRRLLVRRLGCGRFGRIALGWHRL